MLPNSEHLNYICKIISQSYDLPVFLLDKNGKLQFEAASNFVENPLLQSKEELLNQLFNPNDSGEFPIIRITSYLENFISIALKDRAGFSGSILVGPIIDSRLTEEMLEALMRDLNISRDKKEEIVPYYKELPVKSKMKIIYISLHLYYMIYQKPLDPAEVIEKNRKINKNYVEIEDPNISISERRQDVRLHHDIMYEKKVLQCIVEGKKEEIVQHWRSSGESGEVGVLSKKSHLRNKKNLGVTVITLATRAAMEGGIHHEVAYTLSDLYIQNLEELKNSKDVENFIEYVLGDFAERVQKNRQLNYSKPINSCLNYIFNHLYEEISLATLADIAGVHPNYLSSIFKKEVGINIKNYILNEKVEEAKTLMRFTDYSLLKISTLLNFHDQSYFTKTFKKFAGLTPNQYKKNPN
ncbi:helix-turn-helix domain-containing protein [Aquibacillus albus]|uniref:YesN/AraC family two-component response regulator n=1 Tax=Aquibacillus albus TaxID=1168171 RepID=A0ABS2MY11_9BACI|nr:helix-turn-helix domain-containing protein [Aquibacillus albus]MBM7570570.1 YesN/AraC family two-component response regulator [Aquibacillus albus]